MEPVCMIDDEFLKSNLELDSSAQQKVRVPGRGHGGLNCHEDHHSTEAKDKTERNGTLDIFHVELENRQGESRAEGEGKAGDSELTSMLIDCPEGEGQAVTGGQAVIEGPIVGEENDALDTAEMCYDQILPTLPSDGNHEAQEAPLEYAETYMTSLVEREGVLIAAVAAPSSPSSYVQAFNMDVAASTTVTASWEELRSNHAESGYGTAPSSSDEASLGGGNSIEERAFVDSLCEEPSKADCLNIGNDPSLSGPSDENKGAKNTRFEAIQSSGVSDPENEYSSVLTTEDTTNGGGERTCGPLPRKEKAPLGELSLRNVLSDPVTGAFMDDAMVAFCGHSFGSGSLQRVLETHSCANCGASVSPTTLVPNFALRAAILAYKHEDQFWQLSSMKGAKRRREQFQMPQASELKGITRDYGGSAENTYADSSRLKGVQFPFAVSDRVLIKGNKRIPERFFGMEAVITSQCLNGWYLVRMVDTGENVRLQYRSLEKLGEMDLPFSSEAQLFFEQRADSSGSPLGTDNLEGYPCSTKSASDYGPESRSLPSQQDNAFGTSCTAAESVKTHSSERESNPSLKRSVVAAETGSSPILNGGTPITSSQEGGRLVSNPNVVEDLPMPLDNVDEQLLNVTQNLKDVDHVDSLDAVSQKSGVDLLNSMSPLHGASDGGQLLRTGITHDTGAKVWRIGTSMCCIDTPVLITGQGPQDILSAGGDVVGGTQDVGEFPALVRDQGNGHELFRTRSRRSAFHLKSSALSGDFHQDSDPYRKVYTSGSRRRSTKGDSVVTVIPDNLLGDSKPLLKGSNCTGKGSENMPLKGSGIGASGIGKQGSDMQLKSTNEILQIMRKDMLKLEKQIPRNYLLQSWRGHRVNWRKNVKASHTVPELGAQVRDFRYSVLLTTAGGMSDEEWDMRIVLITESGDVELLVSLWGRLYSDVYKWLESRPKVLLGKDTQLGVPSANDIDALCKQNPDVCGGPVSSVCMTTAATLAAVDAVAENQQDPDTSIKTLLASTMKLLQQQSRTELSAVREALEREKRHITAKLAHLEGKFANLRETSKPDRSEYGHLPVLLGNSNTQQRASASAVPTSESVADVIPIAKRRGYETEECDSDNALPTKDADGEATDMSDSD